MTPPRESECKPFRLEWCADQLGPVARWQLITPERDLATAQRHADEWAAKRGGRCRVVEQRTVYVAGGVR